MKNKYLDFMRKELKLEFKEEFKLLRKGENGIILNEVYRFNDEGLEYRSNGKWRKDITMSVFTRIASDEYIVKPIPYMPSRGDVYYTIAESSVGDLYVRGATFTGSLYDYKNYKLGLMYRTKWKAEEMLKRDYDKLCDDFVATAKIVPAFNSSNFSTSTSMFKSEVSIG